MIDTSGGGENSAVMAARSAFGQLRRYIFDSGLGECRSREQFDGLIEDLKFFRDELGVEVAGLLERVETIKAEFEDHESERADHMHDE
ncbi:hypothetical protein NKI51_28880 [Mesorhizobium australicum]|uniref:hypothetical protein n=1 Tax=Mesorhizobium australicum TaxID=536018 RepID=UPI003337BB8D